MNQFRDTEIERRVLDPEAVAFLTDLEQDFAWQRAQLLAEGFMHNRARLVTACWIFPVAAAASASGASVEPNSFSTSLPPA